MGNKQRILSPLPVQCGMTFGRLVVIGGPIRDVKGRKWQCRCDCGVERLVYDTFLRDGRTRSCGCGYKTQGGESFSREYKIWQRMIDRCHRPDNINYRFYGALGHVVCKGWRDSYQTFLADMGRCPSASHSIDRKETNGSYTGGHCEECCEQQQPANCRWATKAEQSRNMKNNLWFTHAGETLILKDWARKAGINYHTLYRRVITDRVPFETAIVPGRLKRRWKTKPKHHTT